MDKYMHVISEHGCETLNKKVNTINSNTEIGVQMFDNEKWYWVDYNCNGKTVMNQISYCPYCGEKLV